VTDDLLAGVLALVLVAVIYAGGVALVVGVGVLVARALGVPI